MEKSCQQNYDTSSITGVSMWKKTSSWKFLTNLMQTKMAISHIKTYKMLSVVCWTHQKTSTFVKIRSIHSWRIHVKCQTVVLYRLDLDLCALCILSRQGEVELGYWMTCMRNSDLSGKTSSRSFKISWGNLWRKSHKLTEFQWT